MKFVKKAVARSCHCRGCLGYGKTWNLSVMGSNWKFLVDDVISDLHFKKIFCYVAYKWKQQTRAETEKPVRKLFHFSRQEIVVAWFRLLFFFLFVCFLLFFSCSVCVMVKSLIPEPTYLSLIPYSTLFYLYNFRQNIQFRISVTPLVK